MKYKKKHLRLNHEDAIMFAMVASGCDFDIFLSAARYICDGKCLEEISFLDFTRELTVEYNGYDSVFEQYLTRLGAA